jgi:adenine C2-methylase RlmN of 23S rRNA A2503 and tRNA A37
VWWRYYRLTRDAPDTQLALSLHAPTQELRNKIVPSASAYKLPDLMAALDAHIAAVPTHANSSSGNSSSSSSNAAAVSISSSSSTLQTAGSAAVDGATNGHTNGSYTTGSYVTADVIDDVADDDDDGLGNFGEPQIAPNLQTSAATVTAAARSETAASATASANGSVNGSVNGSRGLNKRRALIEYVMLSGVNDTVECGYQLGTLLQGKSVVVNLIPYNATLTLGDSFSEPTEEALITVSNISFTLN